MARLTPTQLNVWFRDRILGNVSDKRDFINEKNKIPLSLLSEDKLEGFIKHLTSAIVEVEYNANADFTALDFYAKMLLLSNVDIMQHLHDFMETF